MTTKTSAPAVYDSKAVYTLVHLTCCNCGVLFGLEQGYMERRRKDHRLFTCPNGHSQGFLGPSKIEQELTAARELAARESRRRQDAEYNAEAERRSAIAYKGQATRIRNQIKNGVCPVAGCHRHFTNVQRHIATKHPDFEMPGEQS